MQVPQASLLLLSCDPCLELRHELPELRRLVAAVSAVHSRAVGNRIIDLDFASVAGATPRDMVRYSRGHESSRDQSPKDCSAPEAKIVRFGRKSSEDLPKLHSSGLEAPVRGRPRTSRSHEGASRTA